MWVSLCVVVVLICALWVCWGLLVCVAFMFGCCLVCCCVACLVTLIVVYFNSVVFVFDLWFCVMLCRLFSLLCYLVVVGC